MKARTPGVNHLVLHTVYLFDGYQLDVTRRKLLSAGGTVLPLNSRAMEALLVLVESAGQVVERRRLMQSVWPGTVVEDNNLNQCILAIRRALGEAAGSNRYVMTVQGRGFCFVCPVHQRVQESEERLQAPLQGGNPDAGTGRRSSPFTSIGRRLPPTFWYGMALGTVVGAAALLPFVLE